MTRDEAREAILSHLRNHGKAAHLDLIDLVGEETLYQRIRQTLILEDVAEEHKHVGLRYLGSDNDNSRSEEVVSPTRAPETGADAEDSVPPRKVFLSYGRKDAEDLAQRLKEVLEQDGHTVWIDRSEIKSGRSWETQIEQGLHNSDIAVTILSPHAVRRPEGVCLDEISFARYHGLPIVPVMAISCTPPLGIFRLDWVDLQGWEQQAGRFQRAVGKLREALRLGPNQRVEGVYADLFGTLQPIDFGPDLARLQKGFTGRDWVVDAVEDWLQNPEGPPVFLLTGDPGAGKSAVMAHLPRQLESVAAIHFCRANNSETVDPEAFVRSMAAQLATQDSSYAEALRGAVARPGALQVEPDTLFKNLIVNPLKAVVPGRDEPLLLLVDGLDEALRRSTGTALPTLLGSFLGEIQAMGHQVRLAMSSREVPGVLRHFASRSRRFHLGDDPRANEADLRAFLQDRLTRPSAEGRLQTEGTDAEEVTEWLADRAAGNFQYAEQALLGIEDGTLDPSEPEAFPEGLVGLYQAYFDRLFPGEDGLETYEKEMRPLLDVLVAAREPLQPEEVAEALVAGGRAEAAGLDLLDPAMDVKRRMKRVAAQYPEQEDRYVPFHASVTEWLAGDADSTADALDYTVSRKTGHHLLAEAGLQAWNAAGPNLPAYYLRHLPNHLTAAGRWEETYDLLTTLEFLKAKSKAGLVRDVANDLKSVVDVAPQGMSAEARILRVLGRAIEYDMGFLRRHPEQVFQVCWNRGWWYDSPEAAPYFEEIDPNGRTPPWEREGTKVHRVLERWREERTQRPDILPWVRRLLPPEDLYTIPQTVLGHHTQVITTVRWSPTDGQCLASASYDGTIRVWDVQATENPIILCDRSRKEDFRITYVAWSPDGQSLSAACSDGNLRIWTLDAPDQPQVLSRQGGVKFVAWSPTVDGCLASASFDGTVCLWEINESDYSSIQQRIRQYCGVNHIDWSPDGTRLACASEDNSIHVWYPQEERLDELRRPLSRKERASWFSEYLVAWSPTEETLLASPHTDGTIWIWEDGIGDPQILDAVKKDISAGLPDWFSERETAGPLYDTTKVSALAWAPDGTRLASGHTGGIVRVVSMTEAFLPLSVREDLSSGLKPVVHVDWSSEDTIVSCSLDGTTEICSLDERYEPVRLPGRHCHVVWSKDGTRLAGRSGKGTVRVWEAGEQDLSLTMRATGDGIVQHVTWSPEGSRVASVHARKRVWVWSVNKKYAPCQLPAAVPNHANIEDVIAWSPQGRRLAGAYGNGKLWIWKAGEEADPDQFQMHAAYITHLAWSPSGSRLASASEDGTVGIWSETGELKLLVGPAGWPRSVVYEERPTPFVDLPNSERIRRVAWSPSGERVAGATFYGDVLIWDVDDEGALLTLHGPDPEVWEGEEYKFLTSRSVTEVADMAWSSEGTELACLYAGGLLRRWNTDVGGEPEEIRQWAGPLNKSVFGAVQNTPVSSVSAQMLERETCIESSHDESPFAWFEESGYSGLTQTPDRSPTWAASSGSSVIIFTLENPPA